MIAGEYNYDKVIIESWTDVAYTITMFRHFKEFPIALTNKGNILVPDDCGWGFCEYINELTDVVEIGIVSTPDGAGLLIIKQDGTVIIIVDKIDEYHFEFD